MASRLTGCAASDFTQLEISRWRRRFDIYVSDGVEKVADGDDAEPYVIVTRSTDNTDGKSFLTRLYYSQLGIAADLQRALSSKHRTLYIGPIPNKRDSG